MRFRLWLENKEVYYYASRVPLQPGQLVKGWDVSQGNPAIQKAEQVFEQVRKEQFPNRPSRVGCVFVSKKQKWQGFDRPHLYVVEVQGQTFQTDSYWFGESVNRIREEPNNWENAIREWAGKYWAGSSGKMWVPEIIVQGQVKVLKELI